MAKKILGFDGIRGLAVLSVILTHLYVFEHIEDKGFLSTEILQSINGGAGVQAFFILSGFLITYLLINESNKNGEISLANFYIRRTLRIFPLYFFVLFLISIIHIFRDQVTNWKSISFATLYSYNFVPKAWYSGILGHTWSLAVEEHFYLVWPFVFISVGFKSKKLLLILIVFSVTSFLINMYLNQWEWIKTNFFIDRWSFIAGFNIAFGCFFSILIFGKFKASIFKRYLSYFLALCIGISLWFCSLWMPDVISNTIIYARGLGLAITISWIYLNQDSIITKTLEFRPLSYIGTISYGIYMYQGFFLSTSPYRLPNQSWPPDQYLGLLLLIIVAPVSYHLFEKPITNMKSKLQKSPIGNRNGHH